MARKAPRMRSTASHMPLGVCWRNASCQAEASSQEATQLGATWREAVAGAERLGAGVEQRSVRGSRAGENLYIYTQATLAVQVFLPGGSRRVGPLLMQARRSTKEAPPNVLQL